MTSIAAPAAQLPLVEADDRVDYWRWPDAALLLDIGDMDTKRGATGQWEADDTPVGRLHAIADVARFADAGEPGTVAQDDFNASRAPAGYRRLPTAEHLTVWFDLPWTELLEVALAEDPARALGHRTRRAPVTFAPDDVPWALRQAHRRLVRNAGDSTDPETVPLTIAGYERAADELMARSRRRDARTRLLPSVAQVEDLTGMNFRDAVEAHDVPSSRTAAAPETLPVPGWADAILYAMEALGFTPRAWQVEMFAEANNFQVRRDMGHPAAINAVRARRAELGLDMPPLAEDRDGTLFALVTERRYGPERYVRISGAGLLELAVQFQDALVAGHVPGHRDATVRAWQAWSRGHNDRPSLGFVLARGGFTPLMRSAAYARSARYLDAADEGLLTPIDLPLPAATPAPAAEQPDEQTVVGSDGAHDLPANGEIVDVDEHTAPPRQVVRDRKPERVEWKPVKLEPLTDPLPETYAERVRAALADAESPLDAVLLRLVLERETVSRNEAVKRLGAPASTIRNGLDRLAKAGALVSAMEGRPGAGGRQRRFTLAGALPDDILAALPELPPQPKAKKHHKPGRLTPRLATSLTALREVGPCMARELAEHLGYKDATAAHNDLQSLRRMGAVTRVQRGESLGRWVYSAVEDWQPPTD